MEGRKKKNIITIALTSLILVFFIIAKNDFTDTLLVWMVLLLFLLPILVVILLKVYSPNKKNMGDTQLSTTPYVNSSLTSPIKLFSYFFIVIGGALLIFGVYFTILSNEASVWPSVGGTIVNTTIRTHTSVLNRQTHGISSISKTYYPEINYSWVVDGKSYEGARYGLGYSHPEYSERTKAKKAAKNFRPGQSIEVFYDPNSPEDAVIDRSEKEVSFIPLIMGFFFLAVGILFLKLSPKLEEGHRRYMESQENQYK